MKYLFNKILFADLFKILILSLSYALLGRLSLLLAISPGYASAIFLPTGVGLAALLIWGIKFLPGIFIGSFLLNFWINADHGDLTYIGLLVSLSTAIGAMLQAFIAYKVANKFINPPTRLAKDKDILLFLLLCGPVCCLINASISVTSLHFANFINNSSFVYSWFTWWIGDAIGVMIAVPLMFIVFAKPRELWKKRLFSVGFPLFVVLSIVVSLFVWVSQWESERNQYEFKEIASDNVAKLEASFSSYVDAVASIERFYASSTQSTISRQEFKAFVKYTLENKPGINGLSWNPVIKAAERYNFEKLAKIEGFDNFKITERNDSGVLIPAEKREEYIVVKYIEPLISNNKAHGYDVASSPLRRKTLNESRDSAKAFATAKINLVQEKGSQSGFLLFYPVYEGKNDTLVDRRKNIKGFAVGVFRVGDITNAVLGKVIENKVIVGIYDQTEGNNIHLFGPSDVVDNEDKIYKVVENINVGGRQWQIIFWPSADYLANHDTWQAWAALISGLTFTCMLGAFLLAMTGRSDALKSEVKARTLEIEKTQKEIEKTNRILAERNLQLERSNQELDHYAFVASHDLKSPLQAIDQLSNWVYEDCEEILPEASKEHLKLLNQRVERMKKLLADLLMFARISRNDYSFEKSNLQELVEKAITFNCMPDNFVVNVNNCNRTLELPTIPMEFILRNLLSNAVKHHDKTKGNIAIEYSRKNSEHLLTVSDDGPGIPPHLHQTSVEMFQTLQSRDVTEGSGLGLSIVNKAIERMGGYLKIISDGKFGTTVKLHWPAIKL